MNELDKLFKNKLRDREFEFKDSYWQAAEKLIEEDERKRKRGGLWWRFGLFVLAFALVSFFFLNKGNIASVSGAETVNANQNNIELTNQAAINPDLNSSALTSDTEKNSPEKTTSNSVDEIPTTELQTTDFSNNQHLNEQKTGFGKEQNIPQSGQSKKGISNGNPSNIFKNIPNTKPKLDVQLPVADTSAQQSKTKKLDIAENVILIESPENIEIPNTDELAFLETIPSDLEIPDAECAGCFDLVKLKNQSSNRFSFGVAAEGLYFAKGAYNKNWYGASVGGVVQYNLNRKFALRSGLQLAAINNIKNSADQNISNAGGFNSQEPIESLDLYSFGLRRINTFYEPKSLLQLEMPLLVQFRNKRHAIEAGVQLTMLLGVKGNSYSESSLFPWEQSPLETTAYVLESDSRTNTWIADNNFKKYTTNLMLGYEFSISPRFAINLSSYYNLNGNEAPLHDNNGGFDSSLSTSPGSDLSNTGGKFHFRAGAKWFLK
jgi:outer membrane protein with beta-barrel domain